jgi:hypothetical protein
LKSEVAILDAMDFEAAAIARIKLPFRLHMQVHGYWASAEYLPFQNLENQRGKNDYWNSSQGASPLAGVWPF